MVYNENGIIINEEYILESYFNDYKINSIINESFKDPKTKFGKTVKAAVDWLIEKVKNAIEWIKNIPNRARIFANKKKIKDILYDVRKTDDNKIISLKLKGEIAKYIGSEGYKNDNQWLDTFGAAVDGIISFKNVSVENVKFKLYGDGKSEENWFVNEKLASYNSTKIDTDKIVDFALSVSELQKPLKQIHNKLIKYNKALGKEEKIDIEVMKEINHYFTQAMSSIRNLSYACITVCMNALKGNMSDSIEKGMYISKDKKYQKTNNTKSQSVTVSKDEFNTEYDVNSSLTGNDNMINKNEKPNNTSPKIDKTPLFSNNITQNQKKLDDIIENILELKDKCSNALPENESNNIYFKTIDNCLTKLQKLSDKLSGSTMEPSKIVSELVKTLNATIVKIFIKKELYSLIDKFMINCGFVKKELKVGEKLTDDDYEYIGEMPLSVPVSSSEKHNVVLSKEHDAYVIYYKDDEGLQYRVIDGKYAIGKYLKNKGE